MHRIVHLISLLILCAYTTYSQTDIKKYYERSTLYPNGILEVSALGMASKYFGEFTDEQFGYVFGVQSRYMMPFFPEIGLGFRLNHGSIQYVRRFRTKFGDDFKRQFPEELYPDAMTENVGRYTSYTAFEPLIFLNIFPRSQINYYFFAGYSIMSFFPREVEDAPISENGKSGAYPEWKDESNFTMHLTGGVGIDFYISRKVSVGIQFAFRNIDNDLLDGYAQIDENGNKTFPDKIIESGLKLSTYLFGDSDLDNDGISNDDEESLGLNPYSNDSDDDGISDYEEVNVYKTDPLSTDSDKDGVSDHQEIMIFKTNPMISDTDDDGLSDVDETMIFLTNPREKDSDFDGITDKDEIKTGTNPLLSDTDGDNFLDNIDKCPMIAGLYSEDGCPIKQSDTIIIKDTVIREKITVKEGQSYTPYGVNFETALATVKPESEIILDDVVLWLKKNPTIIIEIRGHTDSVGTNELNKALSELRAMAVMKYLSQNGVLQERMTSIGYGATKPIATNRTEKGRARNRRIEFFVKKNGK